MHQLSSILFLVCSLQLLAPTSSFTQKDSSSTKRFILPTTLVGAGLLFTYQPDLRAAQHQWQQNLQTMVRPICPYDDYLQYVPGLAVFALDLTHTPAQHRFIQQLTALGFSYATMGAVVNTLKYTTKIQRPGNGSFNSFPSGHTATSFMMAHFLHREFGESSPWISEAGYFTATTVAYMRMHRNRHWLPDVMAGAGIGMLSVEFGYWLMKKVMAKQNSRPSESQSWHISPTPGGLAFVARW